MSKGNGCCGRVDILIGELEELLSETAAPLTTEKRSNLRDETFAFPDQRKMPLDTCNRVRNAMARFNQVEGVSASERRTAYNKILRAASKCGIDASGFKEKYGRK